MGPREDDENMLDIGVGGSGGDSGSGIEEENDKEKQQQAVCSSNSSKRKRPELRVMLAGIWPDHPQERAKPLEEKDFDTEEEEERDKLPGGKESVMDDDHQGEEERDELPEGKELAHRGKEEERDELPEGKDSDMDNAHQGKPKPFTCKQCGVQFEDHRALGGHVASHTRKSTKKLKADDSPKGEFKCDVCPKCFTSERGLNVHKTKHCPVDHTSIASTSASPSPFSSTTPTPTASKQGDDDDDDDPLPTPSTSPIPPHRKKEDDDDPPPTPKTLYLFGVNITT